LTAAPHWPHQPAPHSNTNSNGDSCNGNAARTINANGNSSNGNSNHNDVHTLDNSNSGADTFDHGSTNIMPPTPVSTTMRDNEQSTSVPHES